MKRALFRWVLAALLLAAPLYWLGTRAMLGAQAYLFGYPLVIMDVTRANAVLTLGAENQLLRVRQFPNAGFRDVVRPNVDTLYTTAFIDMNQGPWVFEMAPNHVRYELMPFMDAWTNVMAAPGTRSNAASGGRFLLAGPAWQGPVPQGLMLLRAPTRIVWLIGRTQTNGAADYPIVHRLQDGVTLRSLGAWQQGRNDAPVPWQGTRIKPTPPIVQMQAMDTETFFARLAMLMLDNPPNAADAPMLVDLSRIGVAPGKPPHWNWLERASLGLGRFLADWTVARELKKPRGLVRGWSTPPALLGAYGTSYDTRAAVAMVGLGANLPADAMYPNASVDGQGRPLDGSHRYRLHFKAGDLPPVNAFWSITAYDAHDFLVDNPLQRYAIGERDPLVSNADGSLDIVVQAEPAPTDKLANWLPVKAGEAFMLNARLYWPKPAALSGAWGMPAVECLD